MNTLDQVAAELAKADAQRPRSLQVESGASSVHSCRAALLLRTTGAEVTNPRISLATLVGTAVHAMCENAAGDDVLVEEKFSYRGIRCTIDRYDVARRTLTDLKTLATPEKVAAIRTSQPKRAHQLQVQLGAAATIEAGYAVDVVELLYLPRSGGGMEDAYLWEASFDRSMADEAADWLLAERFRAENFASPATANDLHGIRDEGFFFCATFCEYFTACRGEQDLGPSQDDLEDAARRFQEAKDLEAIAKGAMQAATKELYGYTGLAGEFKVRTVSDSSSPVLDTDAVKAREDEWRFVFGEGLPTKESTRRGYVTVTKAAK